jgi:hypothetical protein
MVPATQTPDSRGPSSSLDPLEIPVGVRTCCPSNPLDPDHTTARYLARHAGWADRRRRTADALRAAGAIGSRLEAFTDCGRRAWLMRSREDPSCYRWVADYCHDRFCVPCAGARSRIIADNLRDLLGDRPVRMITLTLRNAPPPLRPQLDRLYLDYRRLRHRKLWKTRVTGAIAFCEITWNVHSRTWHPHLHVLTLGRYIEQHALSREWLAVTGDSTIVDIRLVRNPEKAVTYVAKYATKTHTPAVEHEHHVYADLIRSLNGRRMLLASGECTSWRLLDDHADAGWDCVCHVGALWTTDHVDPAIVPELLTHYAAWATGSGDDTYRDARSPP